MIRSNPGVRRPFLYLIAALLGVVVAMPLAISSNQIQTGGIFDECVEGTCDNVTLFASVKE